MPGRRIFVDTTPLRESRDFRLLFTGTLVSTLGTQLTVVAIPYQVYSMTHSTLQVGAISLAQLFPFLAGALAAGPIGDAVDKRPLMVWTSVAMVLTSAGLALNAAADHPSLVALYLVSSLAAGFQGFANTARMASTAGLVERRHLTTAMAMTQIVFQLGTVIGPALSGVVIGVGLPLAYALDSATFLVAALTAVLLQPIAPHPDAASLTVWQSTKEGLRYLRSRQALQGVYLIDINAMVFGMPRALFPAMAGSVFGGGTITLGLLYAAPGAGALIGALTTGWVDRLRRQGWAVIVAVTVWGAAIAVFGLVDTLWVALVLLAIAGWADVISAVLRNTILQSTIPARLRSRMSSIQMAVVQGGPRLGDLESGAVAAATTLEFAVVSGGLACIAGAAVIGALLPVFRHHTADTGEIDDDVSTV
ncbi:MAG TPA: MFS transporter [Acidimicrobiales bacterium]|nr:MFS transporter [Acidimicrobiales bacterium]